MTPDTKQQVKSTGKTVGIAAIGAAIMLGVTQLVMPPVRKPPTIVNHVLYSWTYKYTNELSQIGFEWQYKTNLNQPNWMFYTNVEGTNVLVVWTTNRNVNRFFRMSKTYRLDMPNNPLTTLTNKIQ